MRSLLRRANYHTARRSGMWCFKKEAALPNDPDAFHDEGSDEWHRDIKACTIELSPRGDWIRIKELSVFIPVSSIVTFRVRRERDSKTGALRRGFVYIEFSFRTSQHGVVDVGYYRKGSGGHLCDVVSDTMAYSDAQTLVTKLTGFPIGGEEFEPNPAMP